MDIDTSGPLRRLRLRDRLYVIGEGMMIQVEDETEARETIAHLSRDILKVAAGNSGR